MNLAEVRRFMNTAVDVRRFVNAAGNVRWSVNMPTVVKKVVKAAVDMECCHILNLPPFMRTLNPRDYRVTVAKSCTCSIKKKLSKSIYQ